MYICTYIFSRKIRPDASVSLMLMIAASRIFISRNTPYGRRLSLSEKPDIGMFHSMGKPSARGTSVSGLLYAPHRMKGFIRGHAVAL